MTYPSGSLRSLRAAALWIAMLGVLGEFQPAASAAKDPDELCRAIRENCCKGDSRQLTLDLRHGGDEALWLAFELLETRGRSPNPSDEEPEPFDNDQLRLLARATSQFPRAQLRLHIDEITKRGLYINASLVVLREMGEASDLPRILELGSWWMRTHGLTQDPGCLEDALAMTLVRDERAPDRLSSLVRNLDPELFPSCTRAVLASGGRKGLHALANMLDIAPSSLILEAMAELASRHSSPFDDRVTARINSILGRPDSRLLEQAALAAGSLECIDACERLIELLGSEDPGLRFSSRRALQRISGHAFGSDSIRWRVWLQEESSWWADRAPTLLDQLGDNRIEVLILTVREVGQHRLHRHELAAEISALLTHEHAGVSATACAALGQLGSSVPVDLLVDRLTDPEPVVRGAALAALQAITGLDLPADDPDQWREQVRALSTQ